MLDERGIETLLTQERSTKTKKGRDNIVLSVYAHLHKGFTDGNGVLHKINGDGKAYNRYVELCKRRAEQINKRSS